GVVSTEALTVGGGTGAPVKPTSMRAWPGTGVSTTVVGVRRSSPTTVRPLKSGAVTWRSAMPSSGTAQPGTSTSPPTMANGPAVERTATGGEGDPSGGSLNPNTPETSTLPAGTGWVAPSMAYTTSTAASERSGESTKWRSTTLFSGTA